MTARTSTLRTVLSRIVLGLFVCTIATMVVLLGAAVASIAGLHSDPHRYMIIRGLFLTSALTPVAMVLWLTYRALRR